MMYHTNPVDTSEMVHTSEGADICVCSLMHYWLAFSELQLKHLHQLILFSIARSAQVQEEVTGAHKAQDGVIFAAQPISSL